MMNKMELTKQYLLQNGCTCAAFDGNTYLRSTQRGVAPLLQWLDEGVCLEKFAVADKVIGCGAAYLYVKMQAKTIHAQVISRPALQLLQREKCHVTYDLMVDGIRNRDNTGLCPIESAVLSAESVDMAIIRIREKLQALRSNMPY